MKWQQTSRVRVSGPQKWHAPRVRAPRRGNGGKSGSVQGRSRLPGAQGRLRPGTAKQRTPPLTSLAGSPHSSSLSSLDCAARASLFVQRWSGRGDQTLDDRVSRPWPPAAARQGPATHAAPIPPTPQTVANMRVGRAAKRRPAGPFITGRSRARRRRQTSTSGSVRAGRVPPRGRALATERPRLASK